MVLREAGLDGIDGKTNVSGVLAGKCPVRNLDELDSELMCASRWLPEDDTAQGWATPYCLLTQTAQEE